MNQQGKPNKDIRVMPYVAGGAPAIHKVEQTYTLTNDSTDRVLDADTTTVSDVADVLATLIRDLAAAGIINAQ